MNGFAAIEAANGWAMALAGASIVLCGLSVLSFTISLIPKILALFNKKEPSPANTAKAPQTKPEAEKAEILDNDISKLKKAYAPLIDELGEVFQLADLYQLAQKKGLAHTQAGWLLCP